MHPHTSFSEALDPVRSTPVLDQESRAGAIAHAELEIYLALLMGQPIVLPEPYSFDSGALLSIASRVLKARQTLHRKKPKALQRALVGHPFLLALQRSPRTSSSGRPIETATFRDMIAFRMRQGARFLLSGWPEMTDIEEHRVRFARVANEGKPFIKAAKAVKCLKTREPDLEALDLLDEILQGPGTVDAATPAVTLSARIEGMTQALSALPQPNLHEGQQIVRDAVFLRDNFQIPLSDRTAVRRLGRAALGDDRRWKAVVELVDSCYSEVLFQASGAETGSLTTSPVLDTEDWQFFQIAQQAAAHTGERRQHVREWHGPLALRVSAADSSQASLCSADALWEMLTDGDVVDSADRLRTALTLTSNLRDSAADRLARAEDALAQHVDLLSRAFTRGTLSTRRGSIIVDIFAELTEGPVLSYARHLLPVLGGALAGPAGVLSGLVAGVLVRSTVRSLVSLGWEARLATHVNLVSIPARHP